MRLLEDVTSGIREKGCNTSAFWELVSRKEVEVLSIISGMILKKNYIMVYAATFEMRCMKHVNNHIEE